MEFRTIVNVGKMGFEVMPCEEILFVGSCFADSIGGRFREEGFPVTVNPFGTMYNPASILHTLERCEVKARVVFLTLGTNHVYRLKDTGEIVDNCQKRPATLFQEEVLNVNQCADYLSQAVELLRQRRTDVHVVMTVSPIRYRKYGYHESQLSKATLLLAIDQLMAHRKDGDKTVYGKGDGLHYFPAYEIVMDELRDYRFYAPDMLHPSQQAVDYLWERLVENLFADEAKRFLEEWRPVRQALNHRPFDPESTAYHDLMDKTMLKVAELRTKYPKLAVPLQI